MVKLPEELREQKDELVDKCLLAGNVQYPESVVSAFGDYVKAFKGFATRAKSAKPHKEWDLLKMVLRRVELKCRQGESGCASAIYQFLTDEAGSKRAQTAFDCMKPAYQAGTSVPAYQQPVTTGRVMSSPANRAFRGGPVMPRGRGMGRRDDRKNRCYTCGNIGHFMRACPLKQNV